MCHDSSPIPLGSRVVVELFPTLEASLTPFLDQTFPAPFEAVVVKFGFELSRN